jgi:serine/threonine-protein kinase
LLGTQEPAASREGRCAPTLPVLPGSIGAIAVRSQVADSPSAAPDTLSRKFRIDGVLGAGGMGVVVVAQHLALDKRVAIKLMRPELRVRRDLVRRFLREARAAARLNSRHVTQVFDVGTLDDGAPYIVMEYLDGIDLAAWLRRHGPVPVSLAAAMLSQAADAIAEAHAIGIVHRDLKPANLFVTRDSDGESLVKVLDLGICKLVERTDDLPDTASLAAGLGTPAYMAPEQLDAAGHADARSDIWSLGVILYELVTGRVPFHGRTPEERHARAARDPVPPMDRAGVTSDFEAIVARCLARDPAARFQAVTEMAAALAPFAGGVRGARDASSPLAAGPARRSKQWTWTAVIAAALAIAGASRLGAPLRGDTTAGAPPADLPRPEGARPQRERAPQPPGPAVMPSTPTSTQAGAALQRDNLVRSHAESATPIPGGPARSTPAAPALSRPRSAIPGVRATLHHPPDTAIGADPFATPY